MNSSKPAANIGAPTLFDLLAQQPTLPAAQPLRGPARPAARPGDIGSPVVAAQHKGEKVTLDERFARWLDANPLVLQVFIRRARQYVAQGREKIGAKRIVEDMRWDESLWTSGDPFKINNLFVSRLARRAIAVAPDLAPYFELRELQS